MRKTGLFALIAALLAAPVRAAVVETAPLAPVAPAPIPVAAPAPLAFSAAVPLAAPALAPAAVLAAPAAAPAPTAASAATMPTATRTEARLRAGGAASAAPGAEAAEAARLFDGAAAAGPERAASLSEIVAAHSSRPLRGVFVQNEQEGSLIASDSRDSSGDVFRYYKPVELRPELVAKVEGGLTGLSRAVYAVRRFFQFGAKTPEGAWKAWPLPAKLAYLDALEKSVVAERGRDAAWSGKVSLLLEKTPAAPDFATAHPHMEAPPAARAADVGAAFLQPEIVSDKAHPAASVEEALSRTRRVIAETGHAGTQYHVFVKAEPQALLSQMDSMEAALQLVNDSLFAKAAMGADANIAHPSLRPWHAGRSARVRALVASGAPAPHAPSADDPDSEKHAFVGFRYWGLEDGKAVVSFELRGVSIPFKRASSSMISGADNPQMPKRDYTEARQYLTVLALYAEAVARGAAPAVAPRPVVLDEAAADAYLAARAKALGLPEGAFDGLAAFARRMTGAAKVPAGYLFPFAASRADSPALRALADELVVTAARVKAAEDAGHGGDVATHRYLFWSAYREWAEGFGARAEAELAALARASAR